MTNVQLKPVTAPEGVDSNVEVINVNFDVRTLRVTVEVLATHTWFYIDFEFPRGFRVLEEGDLLDMWKDTERRKHFLYEVTAGGWLDLESSRDDFVSTQRKDVTEYLVAGDQSCVSVLAIGPPVVTVCK